MLRDRTQIPVHVVAGNLRLGNKLLFGDNSPSEAWASHFTTSNSSWNGHCWVIIGGKIGDISLFRSAYDSGAPKWLTELIVQSFGKGRGALFNTPDGMRKIGLYYEPKHVLTAEQIELCTNGAIQLVCNKATKPML